MNVKLKNTPPPWVDPDDAPELTEDFFEKAIWTDAGKTIAKATGQARAAAVLRRGRPVGTTKAEAKQAVTVRYSPDVLAQFRATGAGWQSRMNEALKEWLRTHTTV